MSQVSNQVVKSFVANLSIPAYTIVSRAATSAAEVTPVWTATSMIVGVAQQNASTGDSIPIVIGGTAKVICNTSISAGALVGPATGTGFGVAVAATFTSTALFKHVGLANQGGSTNSVIEVIININNIAGA